MLAVRDRRLEISTSFIRWCTKSPVPDVPGRVYGSGERAGNADIGVRVGLSCQASGASVAMLHKLHPYG